MLATTGRELHAHPFIADNGMANARFEKQTLFLSAFGVGEAVAKQSSLLVVYVLVLLFADDGPE